MKSKEIKKIQFGGWSKRPFSEIRKAVQKFDDDGENERFHHPKKKVKCRSKAHEWVEQVKPLSIPGKTYTILICKKCGKYGGIKGGHFWG
jgi:hypothetical protein